MESSPYSCWYLPAMHLPTCTCVSADSTGLVRGVDFFHVPASTRRERFQRYIHGSSWVESTWLFNLSPVLAWISIRLYNGMQEWTYVAVQFSPPQNWPETRYSLYLWCRYVPTVPVGWRRQIMKNTERSGEVDVWKAQQSACLTVWGRG
jgi:hypothetical protein